MKHSSSTSHFLELDEARGRDTGLHYWLINESTGDAVVYVKVYDNYNGHVVSLCDIETHPEFQRQGLAKLALGLIAESYGVAQIAHDGGYTKAGCGIAHLLDRSGSHGGAVKPTFDSMTFVHDWTTRTRKYL